jgi:hypothetical protein
MNPTQPPLPLTLPNGEALPPPPGEEYREHTAARWKVNDPASFEFACYLVRELGLTNKSKIEHLVTEHRQTRGLPGISRNTIIGLFNDQTVFRPGEIDEIIKRRSALTAADALDKIEELLNAARAAKDLGAAAMALTAVYNVKQLSSGAATRISGTSGDQEKAKGFDFFLKKAQEKLLTQTPPLPEIRDITPVTVEENASDQATRQGHVANTQHVE